MKFSFFFPCDCLKKGGLERFGFEARFVCEVDLEVHQSFRLV